MPDDITPAHFPLRAAREMLAKAEKEECVAAVAILIMKDGRIWRSACGHKQREILWALTCEAHEIMQEVHRA